MKIAGNIPAINVLTCLMFCFGFNGLYGFLNEFKPNTSPPGLPRRKIISGQG